MISKTHRVMSYFFKTLYILFIAAVLALGLLLIASLLPIPGNYEIKIVQSGSMEPTIQTGALAVIKPADSYQVGDIITFGADTRTEVPTTHRIVSDRVESGVFYYTTKGDANENNDPAEVRESAVIGRVLFSLPYVGYVLDFVRKPLGFVLVIGIPAAFIVIDEGISIGREVIALRRKKQNEKEGLET